ESSLESVRACTLRGQLELVRLDDPVPIDEVEPASEIVKRFATAMNRIGGKSNTGEGGENADRYLNQIKMAQGAKPGEGGELPVGLISPPPHHDIYSIEDLAELIYDLKCANPRARISVKLVSESAGLPWELGVAETHQVLVLNDLRSRVVVQADGQIRTGFDVMVAALLGADEVVVQADGQIRTGFDVMVRQHMAEVGVRKFQDLIGRTDLLKVRENNENPKARLLNLNGTRINISLTGSAGQSFCAFLSKGITVTLEGDANDYVGVGDHGCEYMTAGTVLILGLTGRNFAAGMSGGIAYVNDVDGSFSSKCNPEMVELLPLELKDDLNVVKQLLEEFVEYTGSIIASDLLKSWPEPAKQFVKVFPFEYQRALKSMAIKQPSAPKVDANGTENGILDIEETVRDVELDKKNLEKVLDKTRGFIKYPRETTMYRPAEKRLRDWEEIYNPQHVRRGLRVQAARCMECGVPFCQSGHGCPLGNIIPKWNDLIFKGNWKEALYHLLQTNNFPEFTGRVCPAPCEGACVLGISEPPVTIKNIECAIIDNAFESGWIQPEAGYTVTVFERNDRPGGLLQYGIPTMKLSKEVVMRRVRLLTAEGIAFKCNVDGRQLNGIHFAMEFLENWQKKQVGSTRQKDAPELNAKDKNVLVIGGGDT
ncbi:Uncharacterized protein OBRU01_22648, partial [Operophtera brumata]